jgi:HSP20 family protein
MNVIRWKKTQPQSSLTALDPWRVFDQLWLEPWGAAANGSAAASVPVALDLRETEQGFTVRAEVPGVAPEKLEITLHDDVLTIAGEKTSEATDEGEGYYRTERRFGQFRRTVQLPTPVDGESVEAKHENGVVTIVLKKAASALPKRVEVKKAQ